MPWIEARFKGKQVWAEVDERGEPRVERGRIAMRYSPKEGVKIYRANIANLDFTSGSDPVDLPDGISADAAPRRSKGKKGKGFGSAGTRSAQQARLAAQEARAFLDDLGPTVHRIYTDGGCKGNPGPAGSGVRIEFADGGVVEQAVPLGRATNNIAELRAVEFALDRLDEASIPVDAPAVLLTDSDYVVGVLTKGWKAKKNVEIIAGLRERLAARPGLRLVWVAGHVGIHGNERADALAGEAVRGQAALRRFEA